MRYTLKRKSGELLEFWAPSNGGYIRLESPGRPGTLGQQICQGGGFLGSTLTAYTEADLKAQAQKWNRQNKARN